MNNKGFSLVSVMVAAALAGGVALLVVRISKNAQNVQKSSEAGFSQINLHNRLVQDMLDFKACKATFADTSITNFENNMSIPEIFKKGALTSYNVGSYKFEGIQLKDAKIKRLNYPDGVVAVGSNGVAEFDLEISYEEDRSGKNKGRLGGKTIKKSIPIIARVERPSASSYKLLDCYESSISSICESIGGTFDISSTPSCQIAPDKSPMPRGCNIIFSHKNSSSPARNTFLTLTSPGFAGIRLGGTSNGYGNNVDGDDYFHLDANCFGNDDYSLAFKQCSLTLGWSDSDVKATLPTAQRTNLVGSSSSFSTGSALKMSGSVNDDDNFFIKWQCPTLASGHSLYEARKYLVENCALCFGQGDNLKRAPDRAVCVREESNIYNPEWGIFNTKGEVNFDDIFFIGFYCGSYPGPVIQRVRW